MAEYSDLFPEDTPKETPKITKETPGWFQPGSQSESMVRGFSQGSTFGLGNKIQAGLRAFQESKTDKDFVKNYEKYRNEGDAGNRNAQKNYPVTTFASDVVGSIPSSAVAGAGGILRGILGGTALGAAQGTGKTADSAKDIAKNAALGGTMGAVAGGITGGIQKIADIAGNIGAKKISDYTNKTVQNLIEATTTNPSSILSNSAKERAVNYYNIAKEAKDSAEQAWKNAADGEEKHLAFGKLLDADFNLSSVIKNTQDQAQRVGQDVVKYLKTVPKSTTESTKEGLANTNSVKGAVGILSPRTLVGEALNEVNVPDITKYIPTSALPKPVQIGLGILGGGGGSLAGQYVGEKIAPTLGFSPEIGKYVGGAIGGAGAGVGLGMSPLIRSSTVAPLVFPKSIAAINSIPGAVGYSQIQPSLPTSVLPEPKQMPQMPQTDRYRDIFGDD